MRYFLFLTAVFVLFFISCKGSHGDNDTDTLTDIDELTGDADDEGAGDNDISDGDETGDSADFDSADADSSDGDAVDEDIPDEDTVVAKRLYVKSDAQGDGTGTSWKNAFTDLQDAIDAAGQNFEIWVAAGTYKPDRIVNSMTPIPDPEDEDYARYNHFALKSDVTMLGGFAGNETASADRDWGKNQTVLSGDLDNSGDLSNGDAYHVILNVNIGNSAVIDGFIITGGNANSTYQSPTDVHMWHGGGMNNRNFAHPTVKNCTFKGNSASINGGGISNLNSNPMIYDSVFDSNTASRGGGIANSISSPRVSNTLFNNNSSVEGYGGAVFNSDKSRGTYSECIFENNISQDGGAIANNVNSNITVDKCIFRENSALKNGGAMTNAQSSPTIRNTLFEYNDAKAAGGAIENHDNSNAKIIYSTFRYNTASGALSDGGAILTNSGIPLIISSVFYGNSGYNGGAVANRDTEIMIISSTFYANTASGQYGYGGGVYSESSAEPVIINSIIWGNSSNFEGPEIYNQFGTPQISYSNIAGAFPGGVWNDAFGVDKGDNISIEPNFKGPDIGDFSLEPASPCIDKGTNKPFETGGAAASFQQDYNGNLRIINEITDIGAIEFVE